MRRDLDVPLAPLTTLRVGGPARTLVEPGDEAELVEAVRTADAAGEPLLVLAGGSNVVIADAGFEGTVVRVATRGIGREGDRLVVAAGEPWDGLVASCVDEGLAGVECLSGIPGSTGATPIQNVGAYGQEVATTVVSVRAFDREQDGVVELSPEECRFRYRTSVFRRNPRWVVLGVTFELVRSGTALPLRYAELARALDAQPGDTPPLREVREAVLDLRSGKGMVVQETDPDSVSVGSFFTNPILAPADFDELRRRAGDAEPPAWPEQGGRVKTSAAWLIAHAGVGRGFGDGPAGVSAKHTLAIVNRGGAAAADVLALARVIRERVEERFGVLLEPEPVLVESSSSTGRVLAPDLHEPARHHEPVLRVAGANGQGVAARADLAVALERKRARRAQRGSRATGHRTATPFSVSFTSVSAALGATFTRRRRARPALRPSSTVTLGGSPLGGGSVPPGGGVLTSGSLDFSHA